MIAFRGEQEEQRVETLANLLRLDKSEVLRRAVNSYYSRFEQEFAAWDWLESKLDQLPGSGRSDLSDRRKELLDGLYAQRSGPRR